MKIIIVGTGGVGGYFGARLAEAGLDVTFIARGKHLDKIQKNGLVLKSIDGDYTVFPVKAINNINEVKNPDLIILAVKSWQVIEVAQQIKHILNKDTLVLPLQNGIDNVEKLITVLDKKHVLAGFCKIYSKVENYGIINHFAYEPELFFGELDNQKSERILRLKEMFDKATFKTIIPEDIHAEIWKKFLFISTVSGLGALTRVSIGAMVENIETRNLLQKTTEEIFKIAKAKNINLPENMVVTMMDFIDKQSYESTASTQRDIMEGRPSELENFNGYIVKQGKLLGIKTPVNSFIYNCLLPQEKQARK
jgi:2-dehydropantoate 2-reductase